MAYRCATHRIFHCTICAPTLPPGLPRGRENSAGTQLFDATTPRYVKTPGFHLSPDVDTIQRVLDTTWHCRGCRDAYVRDVLQISPTRFAQLATQRPRRTS